jgi:hypothetical protein
MVGHCERLKFRYSTWSTDDSGFKKWHRGLDFTSFDRPWHSKTTPVIVVMHGLTGGMPH